MSDLQRLLDIMTRLRDPDNGCPWDLQQNYRSIVPHTLEEVYEVIDAIESGDLDALCDELGDLLFQIVFYAQLAKEEQRFDFDDIVTAISDKLIHRHPHVFADMKFSDAEQQTQHWEAIKAHDRAQKSTHPPSQLDGIAKSLPALNFARKLQSRAARVNFDWPDEQGVFDKLHEEIAECRQAWPDQTHREEEIGDLLFTVVNLSRHADVDPEQALRRANKKFAQRFHTMEAMAMQQGQSLQKLSEQDWQALWQRAKFDTE